MLYDGLWIFYIYHATADFEHKKLFLYEKIILGKRRSNLVSQKWLIHSITRWERLDISLPQLYSPSISQRLLKLDSRRWSFTPPGNYKLKFKLVVYRRPPMITIRTRHDVIDQINVSPMRLDKTLSKWPRQAGYSLSPASRPKINYGVPSSRVNTKKIINPY